MQISKLLIKNYRALRHFAIENIRGMVVLAGPNGSGKTCVFDAIRFLKSAYGGYTPDEPNHWFNEMGVSYSSGRIAGTRLFHDPTVPIEISATFELSVRELAYLQSDISEIVRELAASQLPRQQIGIRSFIINIAQQAKNGERELRQACDAIQREISSELGQAVEGGLTIMPDGTITMKSSRLLELLFSTYNPNLGVITFHSAHREYRRQDAQQIQLQINQTQSANGSNGPQTSLYNQNNRFSTIKQELATAYVRKLIAKDAGEDNNDGDLGLQATLTELFSVFIPGKRFSGVRSLPNGTVAFDVQTSNGARHDIDDLSSGEKEVLYGYLVLHNRNLRDSILMIDEPEVHLNPRLISGLPSFYLKHLGAANKNQLWLVTHSDAIVREAITLESTTVVHLQHATNDPASNQASPVQEDAQVRSLLLELVGDMAAYRPESPWVIVEGGGPERFDVTMIESLFPEFAKNVNLIAGQNKALVKHSRNVLLQARAAGLLAEPVYAVVDRDDIGTSPFAEDGIFVWNRYHIENYLLEEEFILDVLRGLHHNACPFADPLEVRACLEDIAKRIASSLVARRMQFHINEQLVSSIKVGCDAEGPRFMYQLIESAQNSIKRVERLKDSLTPDNLQAIEQTHRDELAEAFDSELWKHLIPGRTILKEFAQLHGGGVNYKAFRNLILKGMMDSQYEPPGMAGVLELIAVPVSEPVR